MKIFQNVIKYSLFLHLLFLGFINDDIDDEEVEEEEEGGDVQETKSKRRKRGTLCRLTEQHVYILRFPV